MSVHPYPITVITGKRGSGKTYYSVGLVKRRPRAVVYDPAAMRDGEDVRSDYTRVKGSVFHNGPIGSAADDLASVLSGRTYTVVFGPETPPVEVLRLVRACRDLHLHFDELSQFQADVDFQRELFSLLQISRHLKVSFSCVTQRPQNLHRNLTELADELIVFRTNGERALKYLEGFDVNLDFERVRGLGRGEYVRVML